MELLMQVFHGDTPYMGGNALGKWDAELGWLVRQKAPPWYEPEWVSSKSSEQFLRPRLALGLNSSFRKQRVNQRNLILRPTMSRKGEAKGKQGPKTTAILLGQPIGAFGKIFRRSSWEFFFHCPHAGAKALSASLTRLSLSRHCCLSTGS